MLQQLVDRVELLNRPGVIGLPGDGSSDSIEDATVQSIEPAWNTD